MTIQQQGLTPRGGFRTRLQNFSGGIVARLEVRWQPPRFLPPKSSTILMGVRDLLGSGGGKYGTSLGMGTLCRETYGGRSETGRRSPYSTKIPCWHREGGLWRRRVC